LARTLLLATAGMAALTLGTSAAAQVEAPAPAAQPPALASRTTGYDAAFFAQYAPRSALDIARRVPGFNLDLGNADIRGFAAAAGNVVINGARPSSKAESLETTLARIPARRVSRVELGPGDLYGADYSSRSQVLNIILSAEGGLDGNVTGSLRRLYTGRLVPDGSVSALIRRGASSINLSAGFANNLNHEEGTDTLTDAATGELLEFRRKFNSYHDFNPYLSASWALERASDKALRLNARWSPGQFDLFQRNRVTPSDGPQHDDNLLQDYDNPVFELGGDVTRPLAGGAIKLVGLATRRKRDYFDSYIERNGMPDLASTRFLADVGPWEDHEVALYYLDKREEIGFARAAILGRPEVQMEKYRKPLSDEQVAALAARARQRPLDSPPAAAPRSGVLGPAERAEQSALRAEEAAGRVERAADAAENAAARAEAVTSRMESGFHEGLKK